MRLPSLRLLHSFAVLGETLNVKLAAERLHVTPTAVSHQLRDLELALGFKLFERQARGLAFTDEGRQFWRDVAPAIAQITTVTAARLARRPLRISCFPYLAQNVVLPALAELQALVPARRVSLDTRRDTLALASHGIDLGLRFAPEASQWPGLRARRLCACRGVPVVGHGFAALAWPPPAETPAIGLAGEEHAWSVWAQAHGWQPRGGHMLRLDSYAAVLSAAEQGMGVAMAFLPLGIEALEVGRLRPLWPQRVAAEGALWAVWPEALDGTDLSRLVDCIDAKLARLVARCDEFFSALGGPIFTSHA